jgi:hypothetical protein
MPYVKPDAIVDSMIQAGTNKENLAPRIFSSAAV